VSNLIQSLKPKPNANIPRLQPGDTVRVHNRIAEGDRERVQVFQGVVMRIAGGGLGSRFTVRRVAAHGVGVERTFLASSPHVEKVEVLRHGHVRRARLYYLRQRRGKATRLRERRMAKTEAGADADIQNGQRENPAEE
jgi:large subunit ribosomal protein L19